MCKRNHMAHRPKIFTLWSVRCQVWIKCFNSLRGLRVEDVLIIWGNGGGYDLLIIFWGFKLNKQPVTETYALKKSKHCQSEFKKRVHWEGLSISDLGIFRYWWCSRKAGMFPKCFHNYKGLSRKPSKPRFSSFNFYFLCYNHLR